MGVNVPPEMATGAEVTQENAVVGASDAVSEEGAAQKRRRSAAAGGGGARSKGLQHTHSHIAWPHSASTQECQPIFDGIDMCSRGYRFPPWFMSRVRLSRTSVLTGQYTGFQVYILQGGRDTWNRICVAANVYPVVKHLQLFTIPTR